MCAVCKKTAIAAVTITVTVIAIIDAVLGKRGVGSVLVGNGGSGFDNAVFAVITTSVEL